MSMHNFIKIFKTFQEIGPVSLFFRLWISATPRPIPNIIWPSHGLHLVKIPMCMHNFIKIFHSVQEIKPFSLFQNLALGKASTDDKCYFAIVSVFSEFEPRQKLNQSQVHFHCFRIWRSAFCHFAIPWARPCQYPCVCKILSKYSKRFKS